MGFAKFKSMTGARISTDFQTKESRGYGFVYFSKEEEPQNAITEMDSQWIGNAHLKVKWANERKTESKGNVLQFDELYNRTGPKNCTIYVGGINESITSDVIQEHL